SARIDGIIPAVSATVHHRGSQYKFMRFHTWLPVKLFRDGARQLPRVPARTLFFQETRTEVYQEAQKARPDAVVHRPARFRLPVRPAVASFYAHVGYLCHCGFIESLKSSILVYISFCDSDYDNYYLHF